MLTSSALLSCPAGGGGGNGGGPGNNLGHPDPQVNFREINYESDGEETARKPRRKSGGSGGGKRRQPRLATA